MSDENSVDATLEKLQHESFNYFLHETNPANGLVVDKNERIGLPVLPQPVSLWRLIQWLSSADLCRVPRRRRTLTTLRFFWNSPQGPEPDATGYKGFYYHFLDMQTGGAPGNANCQQWIAPFCWPAL